MDILHVFPMFLGKNYVHPHTQMLHGAGIFTYIYPKNGPVL